MEAKILKSPLYGDFISLYRKYTMALAFEEHVQAGYSETSERSSNDTGRAVGEEMMFMTSMIACQMNCNTLQI